MFHNAKYWINSTKRRKATTKKKSNLLIKLFFRVENF